MTDRMDEIEHTNPHTGEAFGANGGVFTRGPAAADGGTEGDEMKDVEHDAPDGDGANEVWERGPGADETVDDTDDTDETAAATADTDVAVDAETDEAKASGDVGGAKDTPAHE